MVSTNNLQNVFGRTNFNKSVRRQKCGDLKDVLECYQLFTYFGVSTEDSLLQEEVMTIMQLVQDVNAMADDMNKPVDFSVLLVSAEARGLDSGRTEVHTRPCVSFAIVGHTS